jgi:hypothetical protein
MNRPDPVGYVPDPAKDPLAIKASTGLIKVVSV